MAFDAKRLTTGEMVVGASGLLLLIFSFFKWYGVDVGGGEVGGVDIPGVSFSVNGWEAPSAFLSIVAILIGIAALAYVVAKAAGVEIPARLGNVGMGLVLFVAGAIAFLFVLIKFISNTEATKLGIYVGLITTAGLAVGGYMVAKERGELPAQLGGSGGPGGAAPPPRPPAA